MYVSVYIFIDLCIQILDTCIFQYIYIYVMHVNILCMLAGPVSPQVG